VIAAAGFCDAPNHDVEIPGVCIKPLVTAFLTIAQSGERKSSIDSRATKAIRKKEAALAVTYGDQMAAFKREKKAYDAVMAEATKKAKGGRAAVSAAMAAAGFEPKPPPLPMLLSEEGTIEGIIVGLSERPAMGLFSSEAGMFLKGHAFSQENATKTMTTINRLWDDGTVKRLRATGHVFKLGRRSSFSMMAQETVTAALLADPDAKSNGFTARLLMAHPPTTIGTRMWRDHRDDYDGFLNQYDARLAEFLDRAPRLLESEDGLDPLPLAFTAEAERHMISFYNDTEAALRDGERYACIRGFGAKMLEHGSRLAGILAGYAGKDVIDATTFDAGAELATFYASEQIRLADSAGIAPDLMLAERLLEWWQCRPDPRCYLLDIYQRGPNAIREATTAKRIVEILEERGWIVRLPSGTVIDGSARRDAWELTP
jgi:hypothetical protein